MFATIFTTAPADAHNAVITEKESGLKRNVCLLSTRGTRTEALAGLEKYKEIYVAVKIIEVIDVEISKVEMPSSDTVQLLNRMYSLQDAVARLAGAITFTPKKILLMQLHLEMITAIEQVQQELPIAFPYLRAKIKD